jgi:hypothetical protein
MLVYRKFGKLSIVWNNYVIEGMHNQGYSIPFKSNSKSQNKAQSPTLLKLSLCWPVANEQQYTGALNMELRIV